MKTSILLIIAFLIANVNLSIAEDLKVQINFKTASG
jgi:hypothetical protein